MKIWMRSPGHRKNILDSNYSKISIGIEKKGRRFFAVQLFHIWLPSALLAHDKKIEMLRNNSSSKFYFVDIETIPIIPILTFRTDTGIKGRIKIFRIFDHFKNRIFFDAP